MKIEEEYRLYIESHKLECKKNALEINDAIVHSELNAGGNNYTHTLHIPKFFTQEDRQIFSKIVHQTFQIFEKVIQAYKEDERIRKLFPFSKELEELILIDPPYSSLIPICRIDIFYNEESKDFSFCEFNTDGTAAMNENQRLNDFLSMHTIFQKDKRHYEYMELVHSWINEFLKLTKEAKLSEHPRMAIVDFLDHAYLSELYVFEKEFNKVGCFCEVLDVKDLVYKGGHLYSKKSHQAIDVIYRRAVTSDLFDRYEQSKPLFQAIKDQAVCMIGSFQTEIIHHKESMKLLSHPLLQAYFTQEERDFIQKHCPQTYDWTDSTSITLSDKNQWILKPKDSFGAKGVYAGVDLKEKDWQKILQETKNKDYIIQRYIPPYKTWNIDLARHDTFQQFINMTGLYVFNGKFYGVYSRLSDSGIISSQYNERTIPTLFVL